MSYFLCIAKTKPDSEPHNGWEILYGSYRAKDVEKFQKDILEDSPELETEIISARSNSDEDCELVLKMFLIYNC